MIFSEHRLAFPADSGFKSTDVFFFSSTPDFKELFFPASGISGRQTVKFFQRLFVTDENVFALPLLQEFASDFCIENDSLNCRSYYSEKFQSLILVTGSGEKFKTIETVLEIIQCALKHDFDRKCIFTAIGGGVTCDLTGMAASVYKRGVSLEFVPTTLLSMSDASVGGKTGCNFGNFKNMIGTFYPASSIYMIPAFLQSLSDGEYLSGLAEVIKTGLLFSEELYGIVRNERQLVLQRDSGVLEKIISLSVKAKSSVVQEDLKENGKRALLNFGHTFGHALETVSIPGTFTHGQAVAWGMCMALKLGVQAGITSSDYENEVKNLLAFYGFETESKKITEKYEAQKLIETMHNDKKNSSSLVKIITQKNLCMNEIIEVTDEKLYKILSK